MKKPEFLQRVDSLFRHGEPEELTAFVRENEGAVDPPLTPGEYARIASGPLEWADMCRAMASASSTPGDQR